MHWKAPTILTVGLALGIALAIGHHLYYHSLDGTRVTNTFEQTWAIRIGSIFAVSVRVSFSLCLGVSVVQLFWKTFRKPAKTASLETVDALCNITNNPLGFIVRETWVFNPILVCLGFITW